MSVNEKNRFMHEYGFYTTEEHEAELRLINEDYEKWLHLAISNWLDSNFDEQLIATNMNAPLELVKKIKAEKKKGV
ncbi:MAG: hypothetical protein LBT59_25430 [Clostridiales bacterium]|nr:hypothetical protein [Clostridiales bacterium]